MSDKIRKDDAEWRSKLTEEQYHVTRRKGTEPPFTGEYEDTETPGAYVCVCCGQPLFASDAKYHSGSGWPSYWQPIAAENIEMERDVAYGMVRTRGSLQPLRCTSGTRLRRRPQAHRAEVLHQLRCSAFDRGMIPRKDDLMGRMLTRRPPRRRVDLFVFPLWNPNLVDEEH